MRSPAAPSPWKAAPELPLENPKRNLLPLLLVAASALLLMAYAVGRHNSSPVPMGRQTLAVLPFQNLSDDPQQGFFADGLTAEMIAQFGRLSSDQLSVIAWSSMLRYKGTHKNE